MNLLKRITATTMLVAALALTPTSAHADAPGGDGYAECQPSMTDKCPQPHPESCEDRLSGFRAALLESREEGHRLRAQLARLGDSLTTARERIDRKDDRIDSLRKRNDRLHARIERLRDRLHG